MSMPAVVFVRKLRYPQTPQVTLLPIDKKVYLTIATYISNDKQRVAWPSVRTLADDCWEKERTIQRSLSRLEKAKLLHRQCGGGLRTTTYRIVGFSPIPEPGAPIAATPPPKKPDTPPVTPVTPTPVTRDTHPPSPVTPPYKEYESTCERTVKGGSAEPIEAVCSPPNPPPSLSRTDYARRILDDVYLPHLPQNLNPVISAIDSVVRCGPGKSTLSAYEFIRKGCQEAMSEGFPIDGFFFTDAKYRAEKRRKPNGSSKSEEFSRRCKENVMRGFGWSSDAGGADDNYPVEFTQGNRASIAGGI